MEILVNRVYWEERKGVEDQVKPKWICEAHIMSIEVAMRDDNYTEVELANGTTMIINERLEDFKNRVDEFIKIKKEEEDEEERRRDLGY